MSIFTTGDRVQHPQLGIGTVTHAANLRDDEGQHVEVELDNGGGWHGHSMMLDHR